MNLDEFLSKHATSPIWQVQKGHGSSLSFDMGSKTFRNGLDGNTYSAGDICLWVYYCDWQIQLNHKILCHSESTDSEIEGAMKQFLGGTLTEIIQISRNKIELKFSNNLVIHLTNDTGFYADDDDYFTLYVKGSSLSYNQRDGFTVEPSTR